MDSPHNSTPVQRPQTRRRSSFVRCYNCDQWFSCSQLLMQHKTAEHPVAEAVRRMGLRIVKNKESGKTTAIIPTGDAGDSSGQHQHQHKQDQEEEEQPTQPQHQQPPVPDLAETVELLDHLKLLSVGHQRARRRQRRLQHRRATLDSPDTAAAAVAAATAAAAAAAAEAEADEAGGGSRLGYSCTCGALLPDLPLVKMLHMRTAHESSPVQPQTLQPELHHYQQQHLHAQQQSPLLPSVDLMSPTLFSILPPAGALALSPCPLLGHYPLHASQYFPPPPIAFQTSQPPPPPPPLPPTLSGYAAAFQQQQLHQLQ